MKKSLAELQKGQKAIVDSFRDKNMSLKLMEMGLLPGETVSIAYFAPFGDPIAVNVSGYILSMRLAEADTVIVEF
jgi:ferrous iron transport protein A